MVDVQVLNTLRKLKLRKNNVRQCEFAALVVRRTSGGENSLPQCPEVRIVALVERTAFSNVSENPLLSKREQRHDAHVVEILS